MAEAADRASGMPDRDISATVEGGAGATHHRHQVESGIARAAHRAEVDRVAQRRCLVPDHRGERARRGGLRTRAGEVCGKFSDVLEVGRERRKAAQAGLLARPAAISARLEAGHQLGGTHTLSGRAAWSGCPHSL